MGTASGFFWGVTGVTGLWSQAALCFVKLDAEGIMRKVALFVAIMALVLGSVVIWAGSSSASDHATDYSTYDVAPITNAI
jgi:hypothetical protein